MTRLSFVKTFLSHQPLYKKTLRAQIFLLGIGEVRCRFLDFRGVANISELLGIVTKPKPRPRLLQTGSLLIKRKLKFSLNNLNNCLSGRDVIANIYQYLFNASFHFRADRHFVNTETRPT